MEKKFKEVVLKPFNAHGRDWARGDLFRTVSISQRDADFLNSRKEDFGFEYIPVTEVKKAEKVEPKVEINEEVQTEQKTMEVPKPKGVFPKKKQ